MAKNRTISNRFKPIKNYSSIAAGGKRVIPINGKYVEGYNKAFGKSPVKQISKPSATKAALKATTSLTKPSSPAFAKTVKTIQAQTMRIKGLQKMRSQISKATPSKAQPTKTIKRKPPTKGKGR